MLDPDGELISRVIEYRKDMLLDKWCRISKARAKRPKLPELKTANYHNVLHMMTINNCPLCKENIFNVTTRFPNEFDLGDRLVHGNCVLFPNYYPFAKYHLVGAFPEEHSTLFRDIPISSLYNCMYASVDFFNKIHELDKSAKYAHINCNYMPSAAASIIHPHIQVIIDNKPTNYLRISLTKSKDYYSKYLSNFWDDYLASELSLGERFIFEGEFFSWVAAYAPLANYEVIGIAQENKSDITKITEDEIMSIAKDILSMIKRMQERLELSSLNFSFFSGPINDEERYYRIHIRIIGRPNVEPFYVNDRGFMEILHLEPVISVIPEELAEKLR